MISGIVSSIAPNIPNKSPTISIHEGMTPDAMAAIITTKTVCMLVRADAGPAGAPVEKHVIIKRHPARFKALAIEPLINLDHSKGKSCEKATIPLICQQMDASSHSAVVQSLGSLFNVSLLYLMTMMKKVHTIGMTSEAKTATHIGVDSSSSSGPSGTFWLPIVPKGVKSDSYEAGVASSLGYMTLDRLTQTHIIKISAVP